MKFDIDFKSFVHAMAILFRCLHQEDVLIYRRGDFGIFSRNIRSFSITFSFSSLYLSSYVEATRSQSNFLGSKERLSLSSAWKRDVDLFV